MNTLNKKRNLVESHCFAAAIDPHLTDEIISVADRLALDYNIVDYEDFLAQISEFYGDLYVDALAVHAFAKKDDSGLRRYQEKMERMRHLRRLLEADADEIRLDLRGYTLNTSEGPVKGISVQSVELRKRVDGVMDYEVWDTSSPVGVWLADKMGFSDIANIRTRIRMVDEPELFTHITAILLAELKKGWCGEEGKNVTWRSGLPGFADRCKDFNEFLLINLPGSSQNERARVILNLFGFGRKNETFVDPTKFARMLAGTI